MRNMRLTMFINKHNKEMSSIISITHEQPIVVDNFVIITHPYQINLDEPYLIGSS
jgi:hypothetical protein